jgi:hypothetical protein
VLCHLVEVLVDKPIGGRINRAPKMKIQKVENCALVKLFRFFRPYHL